jgi:predicted regulator of Ras-like GTPase activity (Roadblock/LC7/MglB family)
MEVADRPHVSAEVLSRVLDGLTAVRGVRSAVLSTTDGFGLAHSASVLDDPGAAAMFAAALAISAQLAAIDDGADVRQLVVDHDNGLMIVRPIGDRRVLAVLADGDLDQRHLRAAVHETMSSLAGELVGSTR